jgi:hypothetical protein
MRSVPELFSSKSTDATPDPPASSGAFCFDDFTLMSEVGQKAKILAASRCFPLWPQQRTSLNTAAMSEKCQERKWPNLFDHLVGCGEQRLGQSEAEHLGGLAIDEKLELGGLLHGQVGRFRALKNLVYVDRGATMQV